jgi:subtilisin family serine protease
VEGGSCYQWNIRQIHADQTAAASDMGSGVKRARVAVLDAGIWSAHPDIAPNLDLSLSKSFLPSEPGIDPVVSGVSPRTHVAGIIAAPINNRGIQGPRPRRRFRARGLRPAAVLADTALVIAK